MSFLFYFGLSQRRSFIDHEFNLSINRHVFQINLIYTICWCRYTKVLLEIRVMEPVGLNNLASPAISSKKCFQKLRVVGISGFRKIFKVNIMVNLCEYLRYSTFQKFNIHLNVKILRLQVNRCRHHKELSITFYKLRVDRNFIR